MQETVLPPVIGPKNKECPNCGAMEGCFPHRREDCEKFMESQRKDLEDFVKNIRKVLADQKRKCKCTTCKCGKTKIGTSP